MTTETEENVLTKIKAHIIEFPEDKPSDIAALFDVHRQKVYDAREYLRRHKMMDRIKRRKSRAMTAITESRKVAAESSPVNEVMSLKAEIARLNVIIAYLEKKAR